MVAALTISGYVMIAAAVSIPVWLLLQKLNMRYMLQARLRVASQAARRLPATANRGLELLLPASQLARIKTHFEERSAMSALPLKWSHFLIFSFVTGLIGLLFGVLYFKNFLAAVGFAVLGVLVPDQILSVGTSVSQERTHEQLQTAIQVFSIEYGSHRSLAPAFLATVPQLQDPIRMHFERAARRLANSEDADQVLDELAERLNHPFARLFCANCKRVNEGGQRAAELFEHIAYQLNQWRIRQQHNQAAISGGKAIGVILNAVLPAAYLLALRIEPSSKAFFVETPFGRALVVFAVLGALMTFFLNKFLAKADW